MGGSRWQAAGQIIHPSPRWLWLAVPVAAWYSLMQLSSVALSDTPLAFAVLVPIVAGYLLYHDSRAAAGRERGDPFVDGLIFFILVLACIVLLFFLPARLSWYYWLQRLDLLTVPVFATAVVVFFWGVGGVRVGWRALLCLVLVWPAPLVWLQQTASPPLVDLTAYVGSRAVGLLALPIAVAPSDPTVFTSTGPENFTIIIADACSGMNALVGFLVIGLPLVLTWSGRTFSKVLWLATGAVFALASNLLRVSILLYLSSTAGIDFALGTVHPVLGSVLFALLFAGMLGVARLYRLRFNLRPALPVEQSQLAVRPENHSGRVLLAVAMAVVLAFGQTNLSQFGPLSAESLPATPVKEAWALLPDMPGWTRVWQSEISWQDLFGPESQARGLTYRKDKASVVVQFVATPDKRLLDTYSPEQCDLFHGEQIVGVSTVSLGRGISARLVESKLSRGRNQPALDMNTLYWFMPIMVDGKVYHTRIALLTDTEMMEVQADAAAFSYSSVGFLVELQDALNSAFSPYPAARSRPEFADLDAYTIGFARQMVEAMIVETVAPAS